MVIIAKRTISKEENAVKPLHRCCKGQNNTSKLIFPKETGVVQSTRSFRLMQASSGQVTTPIDDSADNR